MPWSLNDYPDSLKNLPHTVKKKAIDIANTLVDEGYDDNRAIPIATAQAKEWYENASKEERADYEKHGDPEKNETKYHSDSALLDKDVLIIPQDNEWAIKTKTAKKASKVTTNKNEAIDYGKTVAKNKGTKLHIYRQDNTLEKTLDYSKED